MPNLKKFAVKFADDKVIFSEEVKSSEEYQNFLKDVNSFAIKLAASMNASIGEGSSFCISPVSAYMSLAIACEISDEATREEILQGLNITYDEMKAMTKYLHASLNEKYTLTDGFEEEKTSGYSQLSSSVWVREGTKLKQDAVDALSSDYMCDVYRASFIDGTAKKMINQYVEYKTHGVSDGDLDFAADTSLAIISTFYVKEIWDSIGRGMSLSLDYHSFKNSDGSITQTPLLLGHYEQGRVYETSAFSTFYIDTVNGYRLHFLIPAEQKTVSDVFTERNINWIINIKDHSHVDEQALELHYTRILFPEFEVSYSGTLNDILTNDLSVNRLFLKNGASFDSLTSDPMICRSIIHKCDLKVTANGFDGTPVAGVGEPAPEAPEGYVKVYHDYFVERSFGFIITDPCGTIVYAGAVNDLN